jgi:hypothetical protein
MIDITSNMFSVARKHPEGATLRRSSDERRTSNVVARLLITRYATAFTQTLDRVQFTVNTEAHDVQRHLVSHVSRPFMDNLTRQFGLIVAYLLPGFIALAGIAPLIPVVSSWLEPLNQGIAIGPPIYALMAATAAGMVVSCFRWLLIDQVHALTGVPSPALNYRALEKQMTAFNYWVEQNYRYHQFYANALIAILFAYGVNRLLKTSLLLGFGTDLGVFILCAVLFAGSRDALLKFRRRVGQLSDQVAEKE